MAKNTNKTVETKASVSAFLKKIKDPKKRADCTTLCGLMEKYSGFDAKMWGTAIVGFGSYHYKYESGREGDAPMIGFASRANGIVLYIGPEPEKRDELMKKLGKHKMSVGCIYIQKMEDIDTAVLGKMIKSGVAYKRSNIPDKD